MSNTIFYSWQSDLPNRTNRGFIEEALKSAIKILSLETAIEEPDRNEALTLDKDTRGVSGSPPIVETILKKIEQCAVFVPDLSFVGKCHEEKRLIPNPNVLIEYGYALKVCGYERIVPVMNSAYGAPSWETLPFDMRHLRHPITYELAENASVDEKRAVRDRLVKDLTISLRPILSIPATAPSTNGSNLFPSTPSTTDPSTFIGSDEYIAVSRGFREEVDLSLYSDNRLFLRMIPETPIVSITSNKRALDLIGDGELRPLGERMSGWFHERNKYGAFVCNEHDGDIWHMTQLFKTGELWGIDAHTIDIESIQENAGTAFGFFPSLLIEKIFLNTLENYLKFMHLTLKVTSRIKMIAGAVDVQDYRMAVGDNEISGRVVDNNIVFEQILPSPNIEPRDAVNPFLDYLWEECGLDRQR